MRYNLSIHSDRNMVMLERQGYWEYAFYNAKILHSKDSSIYHKEIMTTIIILYELQS
jgi:hypothetical protein